MSEKMYALNPSGGNTDSSLYLGRSEAACGGEDAGKSSSRVLCTTFFFEREMSPARWGHPGGCPPAGPASNVVSGKVEKIRENKEHLVPGPFT